MKKVVWIFSINVDGGGAPIGYGANMTGRGPEKFKEKLKSELLPEIELQFISYDTQSHDVPVADLIVFNDIDSKFIPDEIKKNGLSVSPQEVYQGNIEEMKNTITRFLASEK
ncbi:hypothetical protein ACWN8V_09335 [Vagococcus elongatus]|uniref:PTS EIIB type-3 domain-containing protein n=1 Tax=Vagococcus elongatus TaxID=180344 RepID=A0A430ASG2_9ENTE|nr:hypothetical protein [Vagococcus elongatus]RSU10994.1 hypothetical protein CBF29_08510 [Vagococcus elongatus]